MAASGSGGRRNGASVRRWMQIVSWVSSLVLFSFVYFGFRSTHQGNGVGRLASLLSMDIIEVNGHAQHLSYCDQPYEILDEFHLLDCATRIGHLQEYNASIQSKSLGYKAPSPTLAFMFIVRGDIPHEPLWRRFFSSHEKLYSLYMHTSPEFIYPNTSLFHGHQVPSKTVGRFSISLVDAMRRLLAYSILDPKNGATNSWFVFLCESTIPIRSFNLTYNYLINSQHSFVESFYPSKDYLQWETEPHFPRENLRKGEMWMALRRQHTHMILKDWSFYYKFKTYCHQYRRCSPDEQYIQTLLGIEDPEAIENRTIMYVDWVHIHGGSPFTNHASNMPITWLQDIQGRTIDTDGQYHDTSFEAKETNVTSRICSYNGVRNSPCFLFVRKVSGNAIGYLLNLPPSILGY